MAATSTLLNAIAGLVRRSRGAPQADGGPSLPGAAWVTYGAGALVCALALPSWRAGVLAVALAVVGPVAIAAGRQMRQENT